MRGGVRPARFHVVASASATELSWWTAARRPAGWTGLDAALAGIFLILLVTEIVPNPEMTPHGPLLALSVAIAVPIAWRSAHAGPVAVLVCTALFGQSLLATGPFAPQLAVLPQLVVLYTAGTRTRGLTAVGVGAITLALAVAAWLVTEEGKVDDFWPWMLWAGAWASGTFVRRKGDAAAHHASRAAVLEVEAAESAQRERDRIARELHDVVAHSVSVMVVQAGAERLRLGEDAGRTGTALESIEETGRLALAELRTMLGVLRDQPGDAARTPLPGLGDLPALVGRVRDAGLPVELEIRLPGTDGEYGAAGLAAYRIVQEALTNVVRHAGPVQTRVSVDRDTNHLAVSVEDDGASAQNDGPVRGRGLVGMRERAMALGGSFDAGPAPEGGFRVRASLPFSSAGVT